MQSNAAVVAETAGRCRGLCRARLFGHARHVGVGGSGLASRRIPLRQAHGVKQFCLIGTVDMGRIRGRVSARPDKQTPRRRTVGREPTGRDSGINDENNISASDEKKNRRKGK
ncbi:hypothetical protein MTO96_042521 [Rhipicephalus appendiculatus]